MKKALVIGGYLLVIGLIIGLVCSLLSQSNQESGVDNMMHIPFVLNETEEIDPPSTPVDIEKEGGVTPLFHPGSEDVEFVSSVDNKTEEYEILAFPDNNLDTSDWQTYRSEEYGFELRYPSDWQKTFKTVSDLHTEDSYGDYSEDLLGVLALKTNDPYSAMDVWVYKKNLYDLVEDRIVKDFKDPDPGSVTFEIINNFDIYYLKKSSPEELYLGTYYLGRHDFSYRIQHSVSDENEPSFIKTIRMFLLLQ